MEVEVAITLCKLEAVFPPAFFVPIQYRWKYPIDRYLRTLKSHVRNKAQPEGYLAEECVTFCSKEIQARMDNKLQDERKKILVELRRNVEEELQRKLDKECEHVEVDENPGRSEQKIQEKLAAFMSKM